MVATPVLSTLAVMVKLRICPGLNTEVYSLNGFEVNRLAVMDSPAWLSVAVQANSKAAR